MRHSNVTWLRQLLQLTARVDDATFATAPKALPGYRVGSHVRHVLEFYECFLEGLEGSRIDYDARRRDETIESSRGTALERIHSLIRRLEANPRLCADAPVDVHAEDVPAASRDYWLPSSISRELQALSSHTIHHFALISVTLALHGVEVDPDFGMSPSTLRFHAAQALAASGEAA